MKGIHDNNIVKIENKIINLSTIYYLNESFKLERIHFLYTNSGMEKNVKDKSANFET